MASEAAGMSNNPNTLLTSNQQQGPSPPPPAKKKRSLPGTPDPDAEVIALSPRTLLATNRFVCEICGKGFQRDQNLQLHRRGHNLPWKLKQSNSNGGIRRKRVYVCPEKSCVHHNPGRALGDLTGIKKHFSRKHGEKKWKCERCSKRYAVQSDWKAHSKTCGSREYRCDCGTLFSRRDSFITHRAFCDALAREMTNSIAAAASVLQVQPPPPVHLLQGVGGGITLYDGNGNGNGNNKLISSELSSLTSAKLDSPADSVPPLFSGQHLHRHADMSATALLQKAAQIGAVLTSSNHSISCTSTSTLQLSQSQPQVVDGHGLLFPHHHHQQLASTSLGCNLLPPPNYHHHAGAGAGLINNKDAVGREETRDFLGVALCSSSLHGWI